MKKILSVLLATILLFSVLPFSTFSASAETNTSGYYTYSVSDGKATITGCDTSIVGDIKIPFIIGDASGDGIVDADDLVCFRQALLLLVSAQDEPKLDVNDDGSIDVRDLISLKKLIVQSLPLTEDGALTMATNTPFPPYEYYDGKTITGIDIEIAELIAKKLGLRLKVVDMEFDAMFPFVQSGKADICMSGVTVSEERAKTMGFSSTYYNNIQSVIVPKNSKIYSYEDLYGDSLYKIGVLSDSTGDFYCRDEFGDSRVTSYATSALAVEALKKGEVDCVIIDKMFAINQVSKNDGIKILNGEYANESYAIFVAKNNTDLLKSINKALRELNADGSIQKIISRYER